MDLEIICAGENMRKGPPCVHANTHSSRGPLDLQVPKKAFPVVPHSSAPVFRLNLGDTYVTPSTQTTDHTCSKEVTAPRDNKQYLKRTTSSVQ